MLLSSLRRVARDSNRVFYANSGTSSEVSSILKIRYHAEYRRNSVLPHSCVNTPLAGHQCGRVGVALLELSVLWRFLCGERHAGRGAVCHALL